MADLDDLSLDDSYLQHGVAELTPEELEELEKYVGICRNSDVDGENGLKRVESDTGQGASIARTTTDYSVNRTESGESVGSAVQEQRQKAEKIRKAKKWLLTSLVQYESERVEDRKSRHVREDKIFDTIAFAFHYLGDVRLTFGGHGVEWLNGLIKDISRLREDRDELLILDVLQPSILIVSKLLDLVPREFSTRLLQTCMDLARRVYSFHTDGKLPIKGRARGDLFNAYNNIACILIHEHKEDLAEEWIHDATQLVHDDEDDAEVFLCNSAALIAATTDNTSGVLDLLSRAEKVATDALSLRLQETLDLQHEIATRQEKLLAMEDDVLDILPPLGKEFLVRVEGEKVHKISSTVPELKSEIARLEAQLSIQAELASKCKLRIMRVLRKLANFYNRKGPQIKGPPRANHYSEKLMAAITACAPIPFKDDISNTCAIAAYYIRQAYSTDKFSRRKECYQLCLDACRRAIKRIETSWGHSHTSKRMAELYERGAIAAMLHRDSYATVMDWAAETLRLQQIHDSGTVFHARALICFSEACGYCGDPERALIAAKDAFVMVEDLLGKGHLLTKKYNKLWIEHKKAMMKGGGKVAAAKMFIGRMENKQWIRDWA